MSEYFWVFRHFFVTLQKLREGGEAKYVYSAVERFEVLYNIKYKLL